MRIQDKKRIALVLSGGGIKAAAFHIGVCMGLKEKGFNFAGGSKEIVRQKFPEDQPMTIRMYVGSSAGSFISALLSAGYDMESLVNAFKLGAGDSSIDNKNQINQLKPLNYKDIFTLNKSGLWRLFPKEFIKKSLVSGGFESLLKNGLKINGLFTTKALENYLRRDVLIENDFSRLGVDLYIVATELNHTRKAIFGNFKNSYKTNKAMYINYAGISEAVASSASLPPVFAPYGITNENGQEIYYYDGEIRDTLSTHIATDMGADLVIASYSIQPYHYNEEMGSLHNFGIPVIMNQALYQVIHQKIEKHIENQSSYQQIYLSIDKYFRQAGLPEEDRVKVLNIICSQLNFRPEVDSIYIHPKPENHEMFFVDHFSLNPQILSRIVKIGFKSAINILRRHNIY